MFKYLYYTNSLVNANFNVKWGMGTFWKCILVKFELNELVLTNDFLTAKGKVNSSSINASNTEDQNFLMSFSITFVFTDITGSSRLMRISLLRILLLRIFKTIVKIWLMRFYGFFILWLCTQNKNFANATFG